MTNNINFLWFCFSFSNDLTCDAYNGHLPQQTLTIKNSNIVQTAISNANHNAMLTSESFNGHLSETYNVPTTDYVRHRSDAYVVGHVQSGHGPQTSDLSSSVQSSYTTPSHKSYVNRTYTDHSEINKASERSTDSKLVNGRDRYSSRDSGFPGSLERKGLVLGV